MHRSKFHRRAALAALAVAGALPGAAAAVESGQAVNTASGQAYVSLAAALADARDGDKIELGSGSYEGTFEIDAAVTLIGVNTGGGLPVIDGKGKTVVLDVTADGASIEGLAITSTGSPARPWGFLTPYGEEACVLIEADDVRVANNTITGCGQGIYVRNTRGAVISHNTVEDNHVGGIFFLNSQAATVSANTVADNGYLGITVQTFSFPRGIEMSYRAAKLVGDWWHVTYEPRDMTEIISEDIVMSGNVVTGHGSGGVLVGFARRISALANTIGQNGGAPPSEIDIAFYGAAATPGARGFGLLLSCDAYDNVVADNLVRNNDNHGIDAAFAVMNRIERNVVEGSDWGIMLQGSFGNRVANNVVSGNAEYGIRIESGLVGNGILTLPSIGNWVLGNDLVNPGVNAFDNSSGDATEPSKAWDDVADVKKLPAFPGDRENHWDDGTRGNYYSDFDEPSEGFADKDGNGIGELAHPIPGGKAVDRYPLATGVAAALVGEATATSEVASAGGTAGPGAASCHPSALCPGAVFEATTGCLPS